MAIKKDYILKMSGSDYVIVNSNNPNLIVLKINPSLVNIFQELEQGFLPEDIAYRLSKQFRMREDIIIHDINEFINILKNKGIYE